MRTVKPLIPEGQCALREKLALFMAELIRPLDPRMPECMFVYMLLTLVTLRVAGQWKNSQTIKQLAHRRRKRRQKQRTWMTKADLIQRCAA